VRTFAALAGHRTLIDTSAYFALVDVDDINHARANSAAGAMQGRLYTTNYILAETHALLLRRLGRAIAARFLLEADRDRTNLIRVRADDEERAREIIFAHDDKDYSLTDATSFAVMERLHIGTAFTFDRHFAQYGFAVLGPGDP
jgi:predicted nucleic acid-binding protein